MKLSVLDLAFVAEGETPRDALDHSLDLARHVDTFWSPMEKARVEQMMRCSFIGAPDTLERQLNAFVEAVRPDELIVSAPIFNHAARLRSYGLMAEVGARVGVTPQALA